MSTLTTYINKTPISITHDDSERIEFEDINVLEGCVLTQIEGKLGEDEVDLASALLRTVWLVGSGDGTYEVQVKIGMSIRILGELDSLPSDVSWPVYEHGDERKHSWIRRHVLGSRMPPEFRARINKLARRTGSDDIEEMRGETMGHVPAVEASCVQELKEKFDASFIDDDSETLPSSLMLVKAHTEDF